MAMNGIVEIIVVLLSLTFPSIAFTDYYYRPTPRQATRPLVNEATVGYRYTDTSNATFTAYTDVDLRSANSKQKQRVDDSPIVYPDSPLKPICDFGLCVNTIGYPKEQIQKILSRSQFMNGYFEASEETVTIANRFNTDEMSLCETKIHTIYPEKANNTMKVERVIVNVEGHKQGIVFETCVDNGKCKFSSNFPTGYTSYCKQKYIHKRLMVLGDNEKFVFDSFEVPSCCVCTVTRTN